MMDTLRKLGAKLGLWKVVVLTWHDDSIELRRVRHSVLGERVLIYGPSFWPTRWAYLLENGEIGGCSYIHSWKWLERKP